jgi:hypothetical protein
VESAIRVKEKTKGEHISQTRDPFTEAERWMLFDNTSWRYLGMSGKDFLSRWDHGDFPNADSRPQIMRVASLIPLVRRFSARQKSL